MTTISDLQYMQMQQDPQYKEMVNKAYLQQMNQIQHEHENYDHNQDQQSKELDLILKDINESEKDEEKPKKKKYIKKIKKDIKLIDIIKEIGLIMIVYVLLSMSPVKKTFSNFIPQLNKGIDGKVQFTGLLIYGTILGTLVALIRIYFLKQN